MNTTQETYKEKIQKVITDWQNKDHKIFPSYTIVWETIGSLFIKEINAFALLQPNWYYVNKEFLHEFQDEYESFEKCLECGKNYLYGKDCTMEDYLKKSKSTLTDWQKVVFEFCMNNSEITVEFKNNGKFWKVYKRGEYIEFSLPYHVQGGERNYISQNGKSKYLINID